jgi:gluconolactonase
VVEYISAEFEVLDARFAGTGGDRSVARLFSRGRWLEGPAYHPAGRFVLFSDIPNDRVLRYDEVSERTDVFLTPAGFPNGRTVDGRVDSSPVSTVDGGSLAESTMARPRSWRARIRTTS